MCFSKTKIICTHVPISHDLPSNTIVTNTVIIGVAFMCMFDHVMFSHPCSLHKSQKKDPVLLGRLASPGLAILSEMVKWVLV